MKRFLTVAKKEIIIYFVRILNKLKYKAPLISFFYKYYLASKTLNIVKSFDLSTLRYSYSKQDFFSKINYFIINEKYFLKNIYGMRSIDIIYDDNNINMCNDLLWLDEEKSLNEIYNDILSISFNTKFYDSDDLIPDKIKIKRLAKIKKLIK